MFTVCTSAEDGNVDVVKNEIQTNYPNLDLTSIPGNKAAVIGAIEDITDETSLYLYIYSPIDRVLSGYVKELVVSCESVEGEKTSFKIDTIAFSVIAKSNDGAFYKARIDLSSNLSKMQGYDAIHTFSWSNTIIKTNKYSFQNLNDFTFNFDYLSGGSSDKSNVKITYDKRPFTSLMLTILIIAPVLLHQKKL